MKSFRALLFTAPEQPPTPVSPLEGLSAEPCLGDPAVHAWHTRLANGDHAGFRAYLTAEQDMDRRDVVLRAVFDALPGRAEWADRWVEEEPSNPLPYCVRGVNLTAWAWHARTRAQAHEVSAEQFNHFFARLHPAWRDFETAMSLAPGDGSPYALALDAAKGLELGTERGLSLYRAAQERRPWQPAAHRSIIQLLAPKWSHSSTEMWDLARSVTSSAPAGSPVHAVIADAHVEMFMDSEDQSYWASSGVRAEVVDAATRSIDLAREDTSFPMVRARSSFVYCFAAVGERARAKREFEILGPVVGGPFLFSGSPIRMAALCRRSVGHSEA
jgi:hypothetical protein